MLKNQTNTSSLFKHSSESPDKQILMKTQLSSKSSSLSGSIRNLKENIYNFSNSDLYDSVTNNNYNNSSNRNQLIKSTSMNCIDLDDDDEKKIHQEEEEFDGLIYRDKTNANQTLKMLNALRKNRQLCDLILQLDDDSQDIYCHQIILACNSKFFMEIFNNYEQ